MFDEQEKLKYWQSILGLNDWDIKVKIIKQCEFCWCEDASGEVKYNFIHKEAIIHLLDPKEFKNPDFKYDIEKTLIHELLHCKFAIIEKDQTIDDLSHQLIDEISKIMIKLKRRIK